MPRPSVARPNAEESAAAVPAVAARLLDALCRADHPIGRRLTEQALADALGVSRSPVHKAMSFLEGLGALSSIPNRGFFVAQPSAKLRRLRLPDGAESDEAAYMNLAEDRLAGALPAESTESALMQRYRLTRLQVQRVLNRMAREGMVERKAGRGWMFRPLLGSVESHRESYRFRMIIEPAALLEPTFRIDKVGFERVRSEQLRMLDGGIEKWTTSERFRAGAEFHETLVGCSGNRFLIDALRNVNRLRRVIEYRTHGNSAQDRARLYRQCEEHLQLLDLVEAGERIEASYAMRRHLDVVGSVKTGDAQRHASARAPARPDRGIEVHL
ncbi:MAG: GntR family transcriptional regulator [Caldimonas sp.]